MKKYWIVSAHKKEIPGIEKILLENHEVLYFPCGIGLFESFYNFSTLAGSVKNIPEGVLLVGTAGSPDPSDLYKVCLSNDFYNPHFRFEELPEFLPEKWSTTRFLTNKLPEMALSKSVYSSFGISNSTEHWKEFMNGAWENMEALSLSYVCLKKQIPFMAMLCCTNVIGPQGRIAWKQNYLRAGEILIEEIRKLFG